MCLGFRGSFLRTDGISTQSRSSRSAPSPSMAPASAAKLTPTRLLATDCSNGSRTFSWSDCRQLASACSTSMAVTSIADGGFMTPDPLIPSRHRVVRRIKQTSDIATLVLEPMDEPIGPFRAGQFNMLTAFGVGEVAISISSSPSDKGPLEHTIRDVGAVSHTLWSSQPGEVLGVRGPFGTDWNTDHLDGSDVVIVAGGIGLAPLRGAVRRLTGLLDGSRRVIVLVGARTPDQIVFAEEFDEWRTAGVEVAVTVDAADSEWMGHVGVVTQLLSETRFNPTRAISLLCGPEIMMRFTARALIDLGMDPRAIFVSLERNMQCGLGWCGHCQLGPYLLCRDGPVVPWGPVTSALIDERER